MATVVVAELAAEPFFTTFFVAELVGELSFTTFFVAERLPKPRERGTSELSAVSLRVSLLRSVGRSPMNVV